MVHGNLDIVSLRLVSGWARDDAQNETLDVAMRGALGSAASEKLREAT